MIRILTGDCRTVLPTLAAGSVQCVVTSPPYFGLRDYGTASWEGGDAGCDHSRQSVVSRASSGLDGAKDTQGGAVAYRDTCGKCGARRIDAQIGLEATPEAFIATMVEVFRSVRRVMRDDATLFLNLGDSYSSGSRTTQCDPSAVILGKITGRPVSVDGGARRAPAGIAKPKDLLMMPARLALALQADGWWLRSAITWCKPSPMPESARDRCTSATEMVYLLTKRPRYFIDMEAIREPSGANARNWWLIPSEAFSGWTETSRRVRVAPDAGVDGMKRKASPDCPVHGDQAALAASVLGDAHADGSLSRTARIGDYPVPGPAGGCVTIAQPHEPQIVASTLDLLDPSYSPVATRHSSQSHRTDLAHATSPACIVSARTDEHTEYRSELPLLVGSAAHSYGSSSEARDSGDDRSSQMACHSAHTSHEKALFSASDPPPCTCKWYVETTEKTSHFATFPTALAARCIKAGTSERGCCAACGAPWVRVTERMSVRELADQCGTWAERPAAAGYGAAAMTTQRRDSTSGLSASNSHNASTPQSPQVTTTGWAASCACNAATVPCTVLDPFSGAGTTALVADRLGRNGIGIELNPEYVAMSEARIVADATLFAEVDAGPVPVHPVETQIADLFAEAVP